MSIPSCGPQKGPLGKLFARIAAGTPHLLLTSVRVIPEEICLYASTENCALGSEVLFWDRAVFVYPIKIIIKVTIIADFIFCLSLTAGGGGGGGGGGWGGSPA